MHAHWKPIHVRVDTLTASHIHRRIQTSVEALPFAPGIASPPIQTIFTIGQSATVRHDHQRRDGRRRRTWSFSRRRRRRRRRHRSGGLGTGSNRRRSWGLGRPAGSSSSVGRTQLRLLRRRIRMRTARGLVLVAQTIRAARVPAELVLGPVGTTAVLLDRLGSVLARLPLGLHVGRRNVVARSAAAIGILRRTAVREEADADAEQQPRRQDGIGGELHGNECGNLRWWQLGSSTSAHLTLSL